jgi:hypothetical protein
MGLSSNTLWHQTDEDGIKGIIKDRCLYISYSVESVTSAGYNAEFAYPMVSVCDLPLSETGNFLNKYGDYTIGLSSEWGKRNHFAAVWYCYKDSYALKTIVEMLAKKISDFGDKVENDKDYQRIIYILSYIKQYEGPLPKYNYNNYRFYDERELRFVPSFDILKEKGVKSMLWNYQLYKDTHNGSPLLPKFFNISFNWEEVKYIIVKEDYEKLEYKKLVEESSGRKDLNISFFTNKEVREDIIGMSHDEFEDPQVTTNAKINELFERMKEIEKQQLTFEYNAKTETLHIKKVGD